MGRSFVGVGCVCCIGVGCVGVCSVGVGSECVGHASVSHVGVGSVGVDCLVYLSETKIYFKTKTKNCLDF